MRDASEVIAACPFCGGDVNLQGAPDCGYFIACENEACCMANRAAWDAHALIAAWNRRPAAEPADAGRDAEVPCSTHPNAPHGFDRNGSHNADRYVCDCEGWVPDPAAWIVRDVCELDPADPDDPETVCVSVGDLQMIVERHTTALASQQAVKP